ncbi:MAG: hypothetical protein RLZZ630_526 [Bacteroidota bacterium]|jgi:hypothetical protein
MKPRLDRTSFTINTPASADDNKEYWLSKTPDERFASAWYLICCAFNIDPENPPKMDKNYFVKRKHGERP